MNDLSDRVEYSIQKHGLLKRGQSVLVAVSGGIDSMVLLHIFHDLGRKYSWRLAVAHLNHRLRGRSSDADEQLVKATARRLGIPSVCHRADVKQFALRHKLSLEMAAREVRHAFLAQTATRLKMASVALAHHADDQLELFFLRALRGSGGEGLAGMKWQNPSPADSKVRLIRPLLDQSKAALREYADRKKIDFREDTSNASLDIRRNRIRHELLPLLRRKYQPALDRTILRVMDIISRDAEFVDEAGTRWLKARKPGAFGHLPVAVQRRCIQRQLLRQKIPADYELVERLRLEPGRPMEIEPSRVVMRQPNGRLSIREIRSLAPNPGRVELKLNGAAGSAVFDGVRFQWRIEKWKWSGRPKKVSGSEYFDLDNVGSRIVLRHWQPGDRYQPIGMSSAAKLQDLFTNGKIPQAERHQLVLAVAGGGEVFWVERLRISEHFKLSNETIRRLHWRWKRL